MPNFRYRTALGLSSKSAAALIFLVCGSALGLSPPATAQTVRLGFPVEPVFVQVQATATNPETVRLLVGLSSIERDMMLGLLLADEALANMPESHFADPRVDILPALKDGLAAAGIADFEALLITLEGSTDKDSLIKNQSAANTALLLAEAALHADDKDQVLAVIEAVREANARINTAGPTDVINFQEVWGTLIIQRGKIDLLMQSGNPVVSKASADMAMALDDVILSMPDPIITEPVAFDPAPVVALLAQLEGLAAGL